MGSVVPVAQGIPRDEGVVLTVRYDSVSMTLLDCEKVPTIFRRTFQGQQGRFWCQVILGDPSDSISLWFSSVLLQLVGLLCLFRE